jgi:hypothetical protein
MSEILFKGTVTSSPWESEDRSFDFIIENDSADFSIVEEIHPDCKWKPSIDNVMSIYWYFYYNLNSKSIDDSIWTWLKTTSNDRGNHYDNVEPQVEHDLDWLHDLFDGEDKSELVKELNLPRTKDSLKLLLSKLEERSKDESYLRSEDYLDFRKFVLNHFLNNFVLKE